VIVGYSSFRRLCLARDLLRVECHSSRSIDDLARDVRISPFHFIRQFDALFGVTPHQFRIASRVDRAKALLAAGQHSVTDVCMELGFSSLGSFSAMFTARVGETPSAYRRRVRAMVPVPDVVPPIILPGCLSLMAHLPMTAFASEPRNFREA
jgi:AraC-like DNA-binding protein